MTPAEKNQLITRSLLTIAALPLWLIGLVMTTYAAVFFALSRWIGNKDAINITFNWLIGHDQLGNSLSFGNPDETISSRAGRCAKKGGNKPCFWLCRLIGVIFRDDKHCQDSIEADLKPSKPTDSDKPH